MCAWHDEAVGVVGAENGEHVVEELVFALGGVCFCVCVADAFVVVVCG